MHNPWPRVVARNLGLLLALVFFGIWVGHALAALVLGLAGCLAWHGWRLYRLERWLRGGALTPPPNGNGICDEIAQRLWRRQQQHRKREHRLTTMLDRFREGTEALPDAAAVLNEADEVLWCNDASQRLLGLRSPQDLGQRVTHLVRHPLFVGYLARRRYRDGVEFPAPADESRFLSVRVIPYGQDQRLLLAADVTRVQRLEHIRRDFVSNVSHELRTPLTVLGGYLESLLADADACPEHWRQPLQTMQQQTRRMLQIVEDLLLLTRLETSSGQKPFRPVDVPALIAAIAGDAAELSGGRGHEIRTEVDPGLWLCGDEQELRSAFSNLVFNAVRYTPGKGHIVIRWFADELGMHFEVEDDGEGIAPHHIPRLTERFYRVDRGRARESGGSGLGLAIVKHVMNSHDGRLRIASQLGRGSTFGCDFPPSLRVAANVSTPRAG